jgi:signal transduction histidine kinase
LEFFDCVSPEDVIWSTGKILYPVFGDLSLIFWLVTESTGELRAFHSEGIANFQVGSPNPDPLSTAVAALTKASACSRTLHTDGTLSAAALLKNKTGPKFVVEFPNIDRASPLFTCYESILALVAKAYSAAAEKVEAEIHLRQTRELSSVLKRALEIRQLELETSQQEMRRTRESLDEKKEQLVQLQKLASLGQLTAGVAHEINNPLGYANTNVIVATRYWKKLRAGLHQVLQENPKSLAGLGKGGDLESLLSNMDSALEDSMEGMKRVLGIVRDLKAFAHRRQEEAHEVLIHEVINSTIAIAISPYKHRVSIVKSFCPVETWTCDPQLLSQVVLNLVVNAAQAIHESGEIRIGTKIENARFVIEVSDNGCGIPADKLEEIFEPFYTSKPPGEGTGLGLSTCLELIRNANGEIRCESILGVGTTFRVVLTDKNSAYHAQSLTEAGTMASTVPLMAKVAKLPKRESKVMRPNLVSQGRRVLAGHNS